MHVNTTEFYALIRIDHLRRERMETIAPLSEPLDVKDMEMLTTSLYEEMYGPSKSAAEEATLRCRCLLN